MVRPIDTMSEVIKISKKAKKIMVYSSPLGFYLTAQKKQILTSLPHSTEEFESTDFMIGDDNILYIG